MRKAVLAAVFLMLLPIATFAATCNAEVECDVTNACETLDFEFQTFEVDSNDNADLAILIDGEIVLWSAVGSSSEWYEISVSRDVFVLWLGAEETHFQLIPVGSSAGTVVRGTCLRD